MATAGGRTSTAVAETLHKDWYRFSFFQAVRLIELQTMAAAGDGSRRQSVGIGSDLSPSRESLRLRGWPSRSFPATEICDLREAPPGDNESTHHEMSVSFMGLYGPVGVLPAHYTQQVIDEQRGHDSTPLRDFYDLFNHRSLSLFYRAWEKYRFYLGVERARLFQTSANQQDTFSKSLFAIVGLGSSSLQRRLQVPDDLFVYYGGVFGRYPRNTVSLQRVLRDYLDLPVKIDQFQGQWLQIEDADKSRCPSTEHPVGVNCELGRSAIAGDRVWTVEGKFRIILGPLDLQQFAQFVPGNRLLVEIAQITRQYVGASLDFDIQVILKSQAVPRCDFPARESSASSKGVVADSEFRPQLGFNTWLCSLPCSEDKQDAVFRHDGYPITSRAESSDR